MTKWLARIRDMLIFYVEDEVESGKEDNFEWRFKVLKYALLSTPFAILLLIFLWILRHSIGFTFKSDTRNPIHLMFAMLIFTPPFLLFVNWFNKATDKFEINMDMKKSMNINQRNLLFILALEFLLLFILFFTLQDYSEV